VINRGTPDLIAQTAYLPADAGPSDLDRAIHERHARQAIGDLVTLYGLAVDDHDLATVVACYASDGVLMRRRQAITGHDELREFYRASMLRYGLTVHTPAGMITAVDGETASGIVSARAELAEGESLILASFRYQDRYAVRDGRWVFMRRELTFAYAVPAGELAQRATSPVRIAWPGTAPEAADYPETFGTWDSYR
jgi:ketosteroid isomerase-like protein